MSLLLESYICYARPGGPFAVGIACTSDRFATSPASLTLFAVLSNEALAYAFQVKNLKFSSLDEAVKSHEFRSVIKAALDEFISRSGRIPNLVSKHIYFESRNIKDLDLLTASYKIKVRVAPHFRLNSFSYLCLR